MSIFPVYGFNAAISVKRRFGKQVQRNGDFTKAFNAVVAVAAQFERPRQFLRAIDVVIIRVRNKFILPVKPKAASTPGKFTRDLGHAMV